MTTGSYRRILCIKNRAIKAYLRPAFGLEAFRRDGALR